MNPEPEEDRFLPTRRSLLTRLKDWEDQDGWREFFDTYWRFIYGVARKAGLGDAAAQDLVQETLVVAARHLPGFQYDPSRGSFKAWLHSVIRSRLSEHWRRANADARHSGARPEAGSGTETDFLEKVPDPAAARLDEVWKTEWEQHLLETALRRVKAKVSARQYLIFSMAALKQIPLGAIGKKLDVNVAQIYLAKHRVGKLVKSEMQKLKDQIGDD